MYESYYGLTGKPFQLNPDPSFFFGSSGHKRAQAYLEYGLHQSEGFIVITGEVGAGKTTLVRNLLKKLDPRKVVAGQLVSTQLDAQDMLRLVVAAFGLPCRTLAKSQLLMVLETYLVSVTSKGKRVLLIVDEAQNLTPRAVEELRMLSNFQLGEHALLQSFLVGQPEFRATMLGPHMQQLRQRVIASYHLGPMDKGETRAYIEHRLHHVGWNNRPRFEPEAFQTIYESTGGIPRRINTLCDRLMLAGFLSQKEVLTGLDVAEVMSEIKAEAGSGEDTEGRGAYDIEPLNTSMSSATQTAISAMTRSASAGGGAFAIEAASLEQRLLTLERTISTAMDRLPETAQITSERNGREGGESDDNR